MIKPTTFVAVSVFSILPLSVAGVDCVVASAADPGDAAISFPGVLPRPKTYRETGPPSVLAAAGQAVSVSMYGHAPVLQTAQRDLISRIEHLGGRAQVVNENALIHVGVLSDWPADVPLDKDSVPRRPEGYRLSVISREDGTVLRIDACGYDSQGTYYAVQTLVQLLTRADDGINVRQASVVDWPSFIFRSFKGQCWYYRDNRRLARWAPRFKWNVFGPCYTDCPDWRKPSEAYRGMITDVCDTARAGGAIRIMQLGNPYMLKQKAIKATSEDDVETLVSFFELSLSHGSDVLMLCLDDFAYLPTEDASQFASLAEANIAIVRRFADSIQNRYPGTRILLCPPPYWLPSKEQDRQYLRDLSSRIPENISIVWTGRHVTTVRHEAADIQAYQNLVGMRRRLFLWDNTLKMPVGWNNVFRMNAFLEACDHRETSSWPAMASFTGGEAVINTYGPAEIYKVPLMTAADYLWNPEQYDPDDSLRRALFWFDENPRVGPMVYRWINHLHQQLYDQRLQFLEKPSEQALNELRRLTSEYRDTYSRIVSETANTVLVKTLNPYLARHADAVELLADVQTAWNLRASDPRQAAERLQNAENGFSELKQRLGKGDLAGDHDGCVRQVLEDRSVGAIRQLRSKWGSRSNSGQ